MIYMIGIHIASHFFMRGDNKIVVLDGSVDEIESCNDIPV